MLRALLITLVVGLSGGCTVHSEIKDVEFITISGETRYKSEILPGAKIIAVKENQPESITEATVGSDGTFKLSLKRGSYYILGKGSDPSDDSSLAAYWAGNPLNLFGPFSGKFVLPFYLETDPPVAAEGEGARGRVLHEGEPVSGAVVLAYLDLTTGLHGPPYMISTRTDEDGIFSMQPGPGTYFLAARKRNASVAQSGPLLKGDLAGYYPHNPVTLREGQELSIDIAMTVVNRPRGEGSLSPGEAIVVEGVVTDDTGNPVEGVRACLYNSSEMIGRPAFISSPTDSEGRYRLEASRVGTFYLAARSHIGGPPEPGQLMGFYRGREDRSVELRWGKHLSGLDIKVLSVW